MAPMVVVLLVLGYVFYLWKLSKGYEASEDEMIDKKEEFKQLLYCFWPLVLCIVLVIALNLSVIKVLPFIIVLSIIVYRLSLKEVLDFVKTSVEWRIIFNTIILMMFKNILTYTGAIGKLPDLFAGSAIPQFAAFGIIMFLGTIISGANSMIVLLIPLAFASIPHAEPNFWCTCGTFLMAGNADFADAHLPCDHYGIFPGILGAADEEDNPGYCGVCSDLDRILCIAEWIWNIKNMLYFLGLF